MNKLQEHLEKSKKNIDMIKVHVTDMGSRTAGTVAKGHIDAAIAEATKMANQVELRERIVLQIRINKQQAAKCLDEAVRLNKCLKEPIPMKPCSNCKECLSPSCFRCVTELRGDKPKYGELQTCP